MSNEAVIKLKLDTKARLDTLKKEKVRESVNYKVRFLESYDNVIERLLIFYEEHQGCAVLVEGGGE